MMDPVSNEDERYARYLLDTLEDCRAENVLTDKQLLALGKVRAEWGMLEAALRRHASVLCSLKVSFPLLTGNPSGNKMAVLLVEIVRSAIPTEEELIAEFNAASAEIQRLASLRSQLLHGMWGCITEAIGVSRGIRQRVHNKYPAGMDRGRKRVLRYSQVKTLSASRQRLEQCGSN